MAIKITDILNKDGFAMHFFLPSTTAATGANYDIAFPIHTPCEIVGAYVWYDAASVSGTLQIQSLVSGTAAGSGTNLLATAFSLSATARVVYRRLVSTNGDFVASTTSRQFRYGMTVGFADGGDLTNLTDLSVTLYFRPINKGHYS